MDTPTNLFIVVRDGFVLNKHRKWTPVLQFAQPWDKKTANKLARWYNGSIKPYDVAN